MNKQVRYLYPAGYDRVEFLLKNTKKTPCNFENNYKIIQALRDKNKFTRLMDETEDYLLKKSVFNIVIRNIPSEARYSENNQQTKVARQDLRETFKQFGEIDKLEIVHKHLYLKFKNNDDAKTTQQLVNNMQMGDSKLKSECIIN